MGKPTALGVTGVARGNLPLNYSPTSKPLTNSKGSKTNTTSGLSTSVFVLA